jgi:hypothetical protein
MDLDILCFLHLFSTLKVGFDYCFHLIQYKNLVIMQSAAWFGPKINRKYTLKLFNIVLI